MDIPVINHWHIKQIPFAKRCVPGGIEQIIVPMIIGKVGPNLVKICLIDNFDPETEIIYTKYHAYRIGSPNENWSGTCNAREHLIKILTKKYDKSEK